MAEEDRECGRGWPDPGPRGALGILQVGYREGEGSDRERLMRLCVVLLPLPINRPDNRLFFQHQNNLSSS